MMTVPQIFSKEDLEHVAQLVQKFNAYAVLDEVYEHLVFDGAKHLTMRALPGMEDRSIRIGSAGKTFSFTGWKVCLKSLTVSVSVLMSSAAACCVRA